eukprot:CAMPEP_0114231398 /NCGR_PEP_ID=MMETSP0058-20121206/4020_1 /TAXON_ID=36894 /ORGANISM="Pyramimonas parkeae, CCMP726" /LENGTH=183 /DNA_ID=CAMNT_0001342739 /DNA_START=1457 /DNA_END=2009 /DNA_ORIENTATION=+
MTNVDVHEHRSGESCAKHAGWRRRPRAGLRRATWTCSSWETPSRKRGAARRVARAHAYAAMGCLKHSKSCMGTSTLQPWDSKGPNPAPPVEAAERGAPPRAAGEGGGGAGGDERHRPGARALVQRHRGRHQEHRGLRARDGAGGARRAHGHPAQAADHPHRAGQDQPFSNKHHGGEQDLGGGP